MITTEGASWGTSDERRTISADESKAILAHEMIHVHDTTLLLNTLNARMRELASRGISVSCDQAGNAYKDASLAAKDDLHSRQPSKTWNKAWNTHLPTPESIIAHHLFVAGILQGLNNFTPR
jgi:hypothetical protein